MILKQWNVNSKINESTGLSYKQFEEYEIPYSKCELGRNFFYDNKAEFDLYGLKDFNCPDYTNLTI